MNIIIQTVTESTLDSVLPLVAEYQQFYGARPDMPKNRRHFGDIVRNADKGIMFIAGGAAGEGAGFATLYFPFSSVRAMAICLMNDLYTRPEYRGKGIGRALIQHCRQWAKAHSYPELVWNTQQSNSSAQALYDSTGASRSAWLEYRLSTY